MDDRHQHLIRMPMPLYERLRLDAVDRRTNINDLVCRLLAEHYGLEHQTRRGGKSGTSVKSFPA